METKLLNFILGKGLNLKLNTVKLNYIALPSFYR